ncbi:MAG: AraC family transcriptional regulator [Arcicella sp.]|nr:AraC family transcriptional regulator [Arcicella sp.]
MKAKFPVYCIESYPDHSKNKGDFYMAKLEDLVNDFKGIDQSHSHSFYMVMYVRQGSGTHTIDFKTYEVNSNQLYFLTPGQVHNWDLSADTEGFTLFFEANYFSSLYAHRLFDYPFYHTNQHKPLIQLENEINIFDTFFVDAFHEFTTQKPNRSEVFLAQLFIILENASRHYGDQRSPELMGQYHKIRQFEELVNRHFIEKKEIKDYAEMMNISPNYLNSLCKIFLNKTASQLLQERLLIESQRLLTHTELSIKEIVFQLGFNDTSYFTRFFKKITSRTPLEFRKIQNS